MFAMWSVDPRRRPAILTRAFLPRRMVPPDKAAVYRAGELRTHTRRDKLERMLPGFACRYRSLDGRELGRGAGPFEPVRSQVVRAEQPAWDIVAGMLHRLTHEGTPDKRHENRESGDHLLCEKTVLVRGGDLALIVADADRRRICPDLDVEQ